MPETAEMEQEPEAVALAPEVAALEQPSSQLDVFKNRVRLLCDSNTADFDAWVSLISAAEETSSDDIEVISLVYHSFLLEFPLCYGYWIKYAAHKARVCTNGDVVEVYEQAVQAVPHSVDLWVSYCGFGTRAYEDPADIRSLFERALSLVGKDYLCYHLWEKYIEFENSQKQLIQLATIYINTLKFPTKKLHKHYESFRKLVTLLEQEVTHCVAERLSENIHTSEDGEDSELDTSTVIADLFDQKGGHLRPEALKQYLSAGEHLYQRSSKIYKEICCFEASIKRPFFHVKPLDDDQLENWHQYLDYVEKNGDFDWAVKLYERCLIPCANYSEFWIRYAEYVDAKGGREIAIYALGRASSCFVKGVPTFCMYYAMFKEQIGDAPAARSLFVKASSNFTSGFYANINRLANMEKRMGNTKAASEIYETAIEDAMHKQNIEILPDLYSNFAQFIYVATRSIGKAIEVFVKGIKRAPCKSMIKGLIQFMSTYGGPTEIPLLDSVISNAVAPGSDVSTALSPEDREDISLLFLEFVDLYGGVKELRKAWARHSKLFPHSSRNVSQQYCATGNCLQESSKRRRTESSMVAHDHSLEGTRKLKLSSKTDNFSLIVDKEVESQADRNTAASVKGYRDAEEQKALVHHEASRTAQECTDMVHSQHSLDESGMQNQMHSHAKQATDQDLSLREQNDEKANSHQAQSEKAPEAESGNCDSPSKATAHSDKIDSQDKVIEAPASSHPETVCSKSDSPSGASMLKEGSSSAPPQISLELVERQPVKVQVKLDTEHDVSVSNANPEGSNDNPNTSQCGREVSALGQESQDQIQSSQSQQLSVCVKPSSSELAEIKTNTMCFQAQVQHQVDNSQTHVSNNLLLVGENMQQQGLSFTMPQNVQTSSQTPGQLLTQPNQGNQQYLQMMQGYASQMWQYYQQQLYYLQAQHNQQMQSLQQQQLPTEHLQQNFMQQVQQLNQQMVLWQQQVQQQQQQQQQQLLQQALPVQQQSDIKQGPYHSSSGDSKHEQNKQQQQESQMDHQSQQLQQQQLLYFQQQQQQQMYIMQQQQQQKMYQQQQTQQPQLLQQQQLMQQKQYLSQMPQQQQDSVQQQQLFQQQQQQMVLLQQQRQQFIQQHMQQYVQQQQNQQGPKDQNYKLNPQDGRNWQMEHGQQCETSQSDGSKLRSGEQSELSYPSTPQSQRSNH